MLYSTFSFKGCILSYLYLKGVHLSDPVLQGMMLLSHVDETKADTLKCQICLQFVAPWA